MSEELDGWKVSEYIMWVVVSVLGWLGARSVSRLDKLERDYVNREELKSALEEQLSERLRMHRENGESLKRIEEKIDKDRDKLAEIAKDLAGVLGSRHRRQ